MEERLREKKRISLERVTGGLRSLELYYFEQYQTDRTKSVLGSQINKGLFII